VGQIVAHEGRGENEKAPWSTILPDQLG
jgi:hypothetical protein